MLFRRAILDRIAKGDITLAFRRWKRPTIKQGGSLRTAIGVVRIGSMGEIEPSSISEAEARAAGYHTREEAMADLDGADGIVYRIELVGLEPDDRVSMRDDTDLSEEEWAVLRSRFARWEDDSPGYHRGILEAIARQPGTAAAALASTLGVGKAKFKHDVSGLKELGLTESLDVGYRISSRGEVVRGWLSTGGLKSEHLHHRAQEG